MKKSNIFIVTGTVLLAVSAVFASKANKKFATFKTAVNGAASFYVIAPASIFNTVSTGLLLPNASLVTVGSSHHQITSVGDLFDNSQTDGNSAFMPAGDF